MKLNTVICGDSKEVLKKYPDNFFHAIATDPPYEISFMQKDWDSTGIAYDVDFWKECFRVLKPGGHLLSFSATSTYHKMATAIENAGFEIRDQLSVFYDGNEDLINFLNSLNKEQQEAFVRMIDQQSNTGLFNWIYGQGMPKGQNISKAIDKLYGKIRPLSKRQRPIGGKNGIYEGQGGNWGETENIPQTEEAEMWNGWNTSLKPANEPICIARKPISEKTVVKNVLKHETGAFNIDSCRIKREDGDRFEYGVTGNQKATTGAYGIYGHYDATSYNPHEEGRFPANIVFDEKTAEELNEQFKGANRFFFCSKATRKERTHQENLLRLKSDLSKKEKEIINSNLIELENKLYKRSDIPEDLLDYFEDSGERVIVHNLHATVKPLELMRYLVKLICPKNGVLLDPFAGSGTTLVASKIEGFSYVGIDQSSEHVKFSNIRLNEIDN
ncbi:MAG: hypothetical protein K0R54_52 [Clostridiaceae bacterium]|jgi:site-specific DNA-methyltransferase (adenine-specific)|nr:hypothetical protein [Clostridiaceae bacterium]